MILIRYLLPLAVLLLLGGCVVYKSKTREGLYVIYEFGPYFDRGNDCEVEVNRKYGFTTAPGGCVATHRSVSINAANEKLLEKRNGANWRDRYSAERKLCPTGN